MVGVGLAVCVGFSTAPRTDEQPSEPPPQPSPEPATQPPHDGDLLWPPEATDVDAPLPLVSTPSRLLTAAPFPARTQEFVPKMGKSRLQQVYQSVQEQLGFDWNTEATKAAEAVPAESNTAQSPVVVAVAAAESDSKLPIVKPSVDGEGDDQLLIHIPPETDIREVLSFLAEEGNLNILAGNSVQGKVSATLRGVNIEGALDAILKMTGLIARREGEFIFVGTPADFDTLEQAMDKVGTRVYRPNYVTAAELQALIQPLLSATVGVVSVSSSAETGIETDDTSAGGDNFAGADVVLVRDYEAVLAEIDQVVDEIDVRPMQVAIEAMILSVTLDDKYQFGVNFELLRDKSTVKLGWGTPPGTLGELTFDKGGLKFGFLDSSLGTFLDALETIGDTNVIATPRLLVLNKHRAEIHIGGEEGYRGSLSTTETSSIQGVEMLETGTKLSLRPFISSDGMIRMEVHPELSSGEVRERGNDMLPIKTTTQVTTNIMVRDGCTVVIGGLLKEDLVTTTTQIPLFGSLPVVGVAFRNKIEKIKRLEIIVLITPRIVYEPDTCCEGDKAACEFHRRQTVYADKMSPIGKRSIARKYFRLAQAAWAAGDGEQALGLAELSVHFDPLNRAAIDLRSNIWQGRQHGEHTLGAGAVAGPSLSPIDGQTIPDWLLENLEHLPSAAHENALPHGAVPRPVPLHPLDRGRPGSRTDIERPRRLQ
jgi:type IV pilus assembly protein PilQ